MSITFVIKEDIFNVIYCLYILILYIQGVSKKWDLCSGVILGCWKKTDPHLNLILPTGRGFQPCIEPVYTCIHHVYLASEWYLLAFLAWQLYKIKY